MNCMYQQNFNSAIFKYLCPSGTVAHSTIYLNRILMLLTINKGKMEDGLKTLAQTSISFAHNYFLI